MPMDSEEIVSLLDKSFPGAKIALEDLRGDGNQYALEIESEAFVGVPLADQHRMVFMALEGRVGGILRGLTLTTREPKRRRR